MIRLHPFGAAEEPVDSAIENPAWVEVAGALATASAGLELLVAGARGYGALRSRLIGGVSNMLAHAARCPLLVIPIPRS